jgi:hypothetical protein
LSRLGGSSSLRFAAMEIRLRRPSGWSIP